MRLGTSSPLRHSTAVEWAKQQVALGCCTVVFPLSCNDPRDLIDDYKKAASDFGLTIAEVGIWRNAMASDSAERKRNRDYCVGQRNTSARAVRSMSPAHLAPAGTALTARTLRRRRASRLWRWFARLSTARM